MRQYYLTPGKERPKTQREVLCILEEIGDTFPIHEIVFHRASVKVFPIDKLDKGVIIRFNTSSKLPKRAYPNLIGEK